MVDIAAAYGQTPAVETPSIRAGTRRDLPFLREMFTAAANWDPGNPDRPFEAIVEEPRMRGYIAGWGRHGDVAVIAEATDVPVGAAWRRFYSSAEPGYGFVSEETPEVSIGVRADWRGRGIGGALLEALADEARRAGLAALSLAVETANPALRLYLRQGYRVLRTSDEDYVLTLDLQ